MSVAKGNIKTTLVVDGEQEYYRKMQKLQKQQTALRSEARALTSEYNENTSATEKLKDKKEILTKQIQAQKQIVNELENEYQNVIKSEGEESEKTAELASKYNNAYAKLNNLEKELETVDTELEKHGEQWKTAGKEIQSFGDNIESAGGKIESAGKKISVLSGVAAAGVYSAVDAAIDYESAFTGVKKTVDATEEEYEQLYDAILNLSTELPTTASDIAAVAESAGQLGIAKENIVDFSEVMINLGESTNLTSDAAATALAKFANITGMQADDYERLGSVIVDLGNNFATTEADIVNMATRLAATGAITGLSEAQIMALATALSSAGIEAEAGGSSMAKLLKKINLASETYDKAYEVINKTGLSLRDLQLLSSNNSSDFKDLANSIGYTSDELKNYIKNADMLERFAEVSGVSAAEFQKAYGEDSVKALSMFIDGLRDTERNGAGAVEILNDMGLTEVRLSNTVLALTKSENLMSSAIDTANTAWDENTALTNEAEKRYETLESQLQMVKNTLTKVAISFGEELMPYVKEGAEKIKDLAERFSELDDKQKQNILKFAAFIIAAGPVVTVTGKLTSGIGSVVTAGGKLVETIGKLKTGEAVFAIQKLHRALNTASEAESAVTTGTSAVASSFASTGPLIVGVLAATAVIAGLVLGYKALSEGTGEVKETMNNLSDGIEDFKEKLDNAEGSIESIKNTLDFTDKDSKLQSQYESVQGKINSIAETASEERRELTSKEKEELNELFDQLNEITDKELELFSDAQDTVKSMIENEGYLTDEQAAEYLKKTENLYSEQTESIKEYYEEQYANLVEKYKKEGVLNVAEFSEKTKQLKTWRDEQLAAAQQSQEDNAQVISDRIFTDENAYETLLRMFDDYNSQMSETEEKYHQIRELQQDNSLGTEIAYWREKKEINRDFVEYLNTLNQEELENYIALIDEMCQNGDELTDQQKAMIYEIITAYETLPTGTSDAWKDTIESIKSVVDESDLQNEGKKLSTNFLQGIVKGLDKNSSWYKKTTQSAENVSSNIFQTVINGLEIHSPSKKAVWIMEMFNEGLIVGNENRKKDVIKSAQSLNDSIIDAYSLNSLSLPAVKLSAQYAAAVADNTAMQQAICSQIVNNNYSNDNSSCNYYSSSGQGNSNESLREIVMLLNSIANSDSNAISERIVGQGIIKCLKSVGVKL